jgi:hypothetical protein
MLGSNIELRLFDCGELGTDEANSENWSTDQRCRGIDITEFGSLVLRDSEAGAVGEEKRHWPEELGVDVPEAGGGEKVPGTRA